MIAIKNLGQERSNNEITTYIQNLRNDVQSFRNKAQHLSVDTLDNLFDTEPENRMTDAIMRYYITKGSDFIREQTPPSNYENFIK